MYILQLAKLSSANTTIAIGRSEEKLQQAQQKFGADVTVNITKEKLGDSIKHITYGKGIGAIFDFIPITESVESSIKILTNSGKLILVGLGNG